MTTQLTIVFNPESAHRFPVYRKYPQEIQAQLAFISLDIRTGEINADYSRETDNAASAAVWHSPELRFPINPETPANQIAEVIGDNSEKFQTILDGATEEWDGNNYVGRFTDEALSIIESLDLESNFDGGIIDIATWIETQLFPNENQSIKAFAQEVADSEDNGYLFEREPTLEWMLDQLEGVWIEYLVAGHELPITVAGFILDRGNYPDAWEDELREFAYPDAELDD
ncbi:hypothetical protein [Marinomonas shanghaiensis]|uniref:hypothetical protein n=1 Tax=Marinomonas shanghaiensis TaxID=2202418 RepID=UPI000DB99F53|nr:hypothetical protein [Marinomonas shanghaiensis]